MARSRWTAWRRVDGFRPTEVNPRFGAGLMVMTRGLTVPLELVLDLVVAAHPLAIGAGELEDQLLAAADANRTGGTWQLHVATPVEVDGRNACYRDGDWRWAGDGEPADATIVAKGGYVRAIFHPRRTPVGPSIGQRAVDLWRFADAELGTDLGPLDRPRRPQREVNDRRRINALRRPSTRP